MTLAVRNKIVDILKTVPGIGHVHSYQRYAKNMEDLRKLYVFDDGESQSLHGWYVTRGRQTETRNVVQTTWYIVGFLSWSDAGQSELLFSDLVDSIVQQFRDNHDFDGLIDSTETSTQSGVQVDEFQPQMFCDVLCHYTRLSVTVVGEADITTPSGLVDCEEFYANWDMSPTDQNIDAIDYVELDNG